MENKNLERDANDAVTTIESMISLINDLENENSAYIGLILEDEVHALEHPES